MFGCILMTCGFFLLMNRCHSVQINYVSVPVAVQNNSGRPAILDCNYSIRPDDQELVVKWYLNDDIVYQWIPPQVPQSLGALRDRIDISYRATDDPKTVYRSLKIINPTTDVAGDYKCFVSTFTDEDFNTKKLIVFEPERELLLYQGRPSGDSVNFTCLTTEVYPQPKLLIYKDSKDDFYNRKSLEAVEWNVSKHPNGRFTVFMVSTSKLSRLSPGSLINCEVRISGTGYIKRKTLLYYPQDYDNGQGSSRDTNLPIVIFGGVLYLYFS